MSDRSVHKTERTLDLLAIGRRLGDAIAASRKKVSNLAEEYGHNSASTWSNWTSGAHPPDLGTMIDFCEKTGFDLDFIYRGKEDGITVAAAEALRTLRSNPSTKPPRGRPKGSKTKKPRPAPTVIIGGRHN